MFTGGVSDIVAHEADDRARPHTRILRLRRAKPIDVGVAVLRGPAVEPGIDLLGVGGRGRGHDRECAPCAGDAVVEASVVDEALIGHGGIAIKAAGIVVGEKSPDGVVEYHPEGPAIVVDAIGRRRPLDAAIATGARVLGRYDEVKARASHLHAAGVREFLVEPSDVVESSQLLCEIEYPLRVVEDRLVKRLHAGPLVGFFVRLSERPANDPGSGEGDHAKQQSDLEVSTQSILLGSCSKLVVCRVRRKANSS